MNNCAVRTALSGVMGLGLGVLFGILMGSMDGAVSQIAQSVQVTIFYLPNPEWRMLVWHLWFSCSERPSVTACC